MNKLAQIITKIIDFFYTPFRNLMSEQLFRYAACGGGNMVLDWILYFLIYNFVIGHEIVNLQYPIRASNHSAHCNIVYRLPDHAVNRLLAAEIRHFHAIEPAWRTAVNPLYSHRVCELSDQLFRPQTLR